MEGRRSGRKRQPAKQYSVDAFAGLDLTGDLEDDVQTPVPLDEDDADDDEFKTAPSPAPDDDDSVNDEAENEIADEDAGDHYFDGGDDEDMTGLDVELMPGTQRHEANQARSARTGPLPVRKPQSRGLFESRIRGSKETMRRAIFGPAVPDRQPAIQAHYQWFREATLPSRKADASGFGGFHKGYYRANEMRKAEMIQDWKWYESGGGKEAFQSRAEVTVLEENQGLMYLPHRDHGRAFLMGPYKRQKLSHLPVGHSMDLNEAWTTLDRDDKPIQDPQSVRHGFLLNMGDKIQCLDWAPNQNTPHQFLAVTTLSSKVHESEEPLAPAYSRQPPRKAAIQIWEFTANGRQSIDAKRPPKLRQVICTEWGEIKALKWCPAPREDDSSRDGFNVGLLATISGDGAVRVLDVSVSKIADEHTQYILCATAAFSSHTSETVFTSMTWLSGTGLAAGCANGCVAIWNLPSALSSTDVNPTPVLFSSISTSYILAITSCYPSRPHMLLTTSMAGHITMTDLSDISAGTAASPATTVLSPRSRIGRSVLVWHDWSQMAITVDDNYTLNGLPVRRLYGYAGLTRYRSPPLTVAVSPVHPFLATGTAGGECVSYNVMRRAMDGKVPMLNQTWFLHEWRAATRGEREGSHVVYRDTVMTGDAATDTSANVVAESIASRGLSRIVEGFKTETIKLLHDDGAMPKQKLPNQDQGAPFSTIHEVESGVTQVCWNPNLLFGGWIAAGMACGLLRVEDIAL